MLLAIQQSQAAESGIGERANAPVRLRMILTAMHASRSFQSFARIRTTLTL